MMNVHHEPDGAEAGPAPGRNRLLLDLQEFFQFFKGHRLKDDRIEAADVEMIAVFDIGGHGDQTGLRGEIAGPDGAGPAPFR